MALRTLKGSEIPHGAIAVPQEEALKFQWQFIKGWPSEYEVLTLKFGRHITSATTLISSAYILNFLKNYLHINKARFILALSPGAIVPSVVSYYLTDKLTTNPTLLMKFSCPLCDQMKFAACQLYLGVVFPAFYGYFGLISYASASQSFQVPNIKTHAREFWKMSFEILKRGSTHLQYAGLLHTIVVLFLPYFQNKQLSSVMAKAQQEELEETDNELPYRV